MFGVENLRYVSVVILSSMQATCLEDSSVVRDFGFVGRT